MKIHKHRKSPNYKYWVKHKLGTKVKLKKKDSQEAKPLAPYLDFAVPPLSFLDVVQTNTKFGKSHRLFLAREVGSALPQWLIFKLMVQMCFLHVGKKKVLAEDETQETKLDHPIVLASGNV